ncbi:MAG: cob(I)yrinic acid a,c-diamide adenosyltransferase [Flavobacteriaceae bacterium]
MYQLHLIVEEKWRGHMREHKIYTKTGDSGITSLISGKRVPKHDTRIKAYGTVDELVAWLGLIRDTTEQSTIKATLLEIQKHLMTIASQLSIEEGCNFPKNLHPIQTQAVTFIEQEIDTLTERLPELRNFIIPGGHPSVSYSHLARCVCRRAERFVTELNQTSPVSPILIAYMNRLSDYFFTLSRCFTIEFGVEEIKWNGN